MKKYLLGLLLVGSFLLLSACSLYPTYYSEADVVRYARHHYGDVTLTGQNTIIKDIGTEDYPEPIEWYEYLFEGEDGIDFTVVSTTSHVGFISGPTAFYSASLYDTYVDAAIAQRMGSVSKILQYSGIEYDVTPGKNLKFYLTDLSQLEAFSALFATLDQHIALDYAYPSPQFTMVYSRGHFREVDVYLKPNNPAYVQEDPDDWRSLRDIAIGQSFCLSTQPTDRWEADEVFAVLQSEVVDEVREHQTDPTYSPYVVPEEWLASVPYDALNYEAADGTAADEDGFSGLRTLHYNYKEGLYYHRLYVDLEALLVAMVPAAGGTMLTDLETESSFSPSTFEWQIGADQYAIHVLTDSHQHFPLYVFEKNGEEFLLDSNRLPYHQRGTCFSVADLELLFDISITIPSDDNIFSVAPAAQ